MLEGLRDWEDDHGSINLPGTKSGRPQKMRPPTESAHGIEKMLAYRRRVGEEFERMVGKIKIEAKPAIDAGVVES